MAVDPYQDMARQVAVMTRALRRMPAASRQYMDDQMRKAGDRVAREIDQAAGGVPKPAARYARALRNGGIQVKPGRGDLKIVIGGSRQSGIGKLTMRQLVGGAEFGGGRKVTTYTQKRRNGTCTVRRHTTAQFGRPNPDGRFIYPTWQREQGPTLERWAAAVAKMLDDYWADVAAHG